MELSKTQIYEILTHLTRYGEILNEYWPTTPQKEVSDLIYQLEQILDSEH